MKTKQWFAILAALVGFGAAAHRVSVPVTPRDVPEAVKRKVLDDVGIPKAERKNYVVDHKIPLELGGTNDISNLQAETIAAGKAKDKLERELTAKVRAGAMPLAEAQKILANTK